MFYLKEICAVILQYQKINIMNQTNLTDNQIKVIKALENEHLTSFEILKKVDNISLILVVYTILDELESMGVLKSYRKKKMKFHYTC